MAEVTSLVQEARWVVVMHHDGSDDCGDDWDDDHDGQRVWFN